MSTAALVLAACLGHRFAGPLPKLRTPLRGRPLGAWALAAAFDAGLDDVIVVVGEDDLADLVPAGALVVTNPDAASGQATSLACGVRAAGAAGHDVVVVGLADQPGVPPAAWRSVADADADVATATFGGERRPPVRLARAVWELLPTDGDEGARALFRRCPDLVLSFLWCLFYLVF